MSRDEDIKARIKEKDEKIAKYVADKDLNIRVSWAINNATGMVKAISDTELQKSQIREWANWFLSYFEELRGQEAGKLVEKDNGEQAL